MTTTIVQCTMCGFKWKPSITLAMLDGVEGIEKEKEEIRKNSIQCHNCKSFRVPVVVPPEDYFEK